MVCWLMIVIRHSTLGERLESSVLHTVQSKAICFVDTALWSVECK